MAASQVRIREISFKLSGYVEDAEDQQQKAGSKNQGMKHTCAAGV